jgi:hypothetical protein
MTDREASTKKSKKISMYAVYSNFHCSLTWKESTRLSLNSPAGSAWGPPADFCTPHQRKIYAFGFLVFRMLEIAIPIRGYTVARTLLCKVDLP